MLTKNLIRKKRERFGGGQSERNVAVYDVEPQFMQRGTRIAMGWLTWRKPAKKPWPFKRKTVIA